VTQATGEQAKTWRLRNRYNRPQLSRLIGYSVAAIQNIEDGVYRTKPHPISDAVMRRYRLACAAVAHDLQDWEFE
jgi:hypothetical protein